jgi:hypothetical protein
VGVLERLGIGRAPWERDEEDDYVAPIRTDNQLGTGLRTPINPPPRRVAPPIDETWEEDNWEQEEPRQIRKQEERRAELYYDDEDEEENWSEKSNTDRYSTPIAPSECLLRRGRSRSL